MKSTFKSIYLKPKKERAVLNRHPWVFSGAVGKLDAGLKIGDPVVVRDHAGNFLAVGHWRGADGLVCRLVCFDQDRVVDDAFFVQRFFDAKKLRTGLGLPSAQTTGYRLLNGEGDGLPGLVCDLYETTACIRSSNPGLLPVIPKLCDFLASHCACRDIYFDNSDEKVSSWLIGGEHRCEFLENGLRFLADISDGQKTGHFLDQRYNRSLVGEFSSGRTVLDAFSYSGGFSVYALRGEAKRVMSVDISANAVELCRINVRNNGFAGGNDAEVADCFDYLRQIKKGDYDLIILDPPAFAKTTHAVPQAARGYKDINLNAMKAVRKGGFLFTFSCSQHVDTDLFKKIIFAAAKDSGRDVNIIAELSQGFDHPVSVYCPQSHYLKGMGLYVR